MPIHREFLGGDPNSATTLRPALIAAAEYLLARYQRGSQVRLGAVIVVLPSSRAGRRLLEILVEACERQQLILEPPILGTLGSMPEHLYEIKKPLASELTQRLAWADALRKTAPKLLQHLLPHPPAADDWESWLELGVLLQTQHRELASDRHDFDSVLKAAKGFPEFAEELRWKTLADVQKRYLALLDSLEVWDIQTARLFAIKYEECRTDRDLVLVGVSDMNNAMRAMLDLVAPRVTALVHAPSTWSDRFDAYGCVLADVWCKAEIPFDDSRVLRVDTPGDQAYTVAGQLAQLGGKFGADEITIGLGDPQLAAQIARQLEEFSIATRYIEAHTVESTGPYLLLTAVREYLTLPTFAAFAALVRHPDVYAWLIGQGVSYAVLSELDEVQVCRLPTEMLACDDWLKKDWPAAAAALDKVCAWLKPLQASTRKLAAWLEPVEQCLVEVYRQRAFNRHDAADHATVEACEHLHSALAELTKVPATLAPSTTAADALRLVLAGVAGCKIAPRADSQAIEMLGWFELPLDDAPVLLVTSFNEGFIPASHGADLFLPNRLRQHLGLNHSDRTYARDAYAASVLLASRQQVTWIVGRHDVERNPLAPSRLLFAAAREKIAERASKYFNDDSIVELPKLLLGGAFAPLAESRLEVPLPLPIDALPTSLRVTDFRTYLACPYRFYLKRLMRLSALCDAAEELDAMQFGSLLHDVLQAFGDCDEAKALTDEHRLADWLATQLYAIARDGLGAKRRPAVDVQVEQLRARLVAFARWQSQRTSEGWQIKHVEIDAKQQLTFGEIAVEIQGRIDRIDHHPDRQEWVVFDYKSGDSGSSPQDTHRHKDEWLDLQLPLYRRLAPQITGDSRPPSVGYIVLPKRVSEVGHVLAEWDEPDWQSAEAVAARVVADIFSRKFWPPSYEPRALNDDVASICQDLVAGRRLANAEVAT